MFEVCLDKISGFTPAKFLRLNAERGAELSGEVLESDERRQLDDRIPIEVPYMPHGQLVGGARNFLHSC